MSEIVMEIQHQFASFLNLVSVQILISSLLLNFVVKAQQPVRQNFRLYEKEGLNTFEIPKNDAVPFTGFRMRLGLNTSSQFLR